MTSNRRFSRMLCMGAGFTAALMMGAPPAAARDHEAAGGRGSGAAPSRAAPSRAAPSPRVRAPGAVSPPRFRPAPAPRYTGPRFVPAPRPYFGRRPVVVAPLIVAPLYYGDPYPAVPSELAAPYAEAPPVYVEDQGMAEGEPPPAAEPAAAEPQDAWYYCEDSKTYYPYVQSCASPWARVAPYPGAAAVP